MFKDGVAHGLQLYRTGKRSEAAKAFEAVLEDDPQQPDALHLLGVLKAQAGDTSGGLTLIRKALALRPEFGEAHYNMGRIFQSLNAHQDAIHAYTRAAHEKHGYAKAWNNLGSVYADIGLFDEAIRSYKKGLSADDGELSLYDNLCRVFKRQAQYEDCIKAADRGLNLHPDSASLWIHRSESCFALGRLQEAWYAYKWRLNHAENPNQHLPVSLPIWDGEDLSDKSILIRTEQGPGETFLFSSMLRDVISAAKRCDVSTSKRLRPILKRSFPNIDVIEEDSLPGANLTQDAQCFLPDLGGWFRASWESFSFSHGHILADADRTAALRRGYEEQAHGSMLVGIAWRSEGGATSSHKSAPLDLWKPILSTPGVTFINLQYGDTSAELAALEATSEIKILSDPAIDAVADLDSHLAQIAALDLVITISNTTAHAAGALGQPVWCLLPSRLSEGLRWPWFVDRRDSPWYPSAQLYRQQRFGDWSDPIADAAIDLVGLVCSKSAQINQANHLNSLALAFHKAGQFGPMGRAAEAALALGSTKLLPVRLAAKSKTHAGKPEEALSLLRGAQSTTVESDDLGIILERADALVQTGQPKDAIALYTKYLEHKTDDVAVLDRLGKACRLSGDIQSATSCFERALTITPIQTSIKESLGTALYEQGRIDDAMRVLDELVSDDPEHHRAATARAITLLANERFDQGWPAFRSRLKQPTANVRYERFSVPAWSGQPIEGANILVWTEQGIGEEILIATLVGDLAQTAGSISLLCSDRMIPLFKRSFPGLKVDSRSEPLSPLVTQRDIDFQMSWGDLGQVLRPTRQSFLDTKQGKILTPDADTVKQFRTHYKEQTHSRKLVGISWFSGTPDLGPLKSMPPLLLAELIDASDAAFVNLQYSPEPRDLEIMAKHGGQKWICDMSVDPLKDMDRAAAQVAALDYVVTVSNTTAHLAGAMGIPTGLLVPPNSGRHWYWFRNETRALWYDCVSFFETYPGSTWVDAIPRIAEAIRLQKPA